MAADVPFGVSFGDPRKYMGSSGIGPALKTGLTAYAMKQSGLTDWLNSLGKKPEGAVPPITSGAAGNQMKDGVWGTNPMPVVPPSFMQQPAGAVPPAFNPPVQQQPQPESTPVQQDPAQLGRDWLNGNVSSFVNPQAQRDIPVAQATGYNEMLKTGNEYQQVPGYGKLQKAFQMFMG